jgi:hypothetical protein
VKKGAASAHFPEGIRHVGHVRFRSRAFIAIVVAMVALAAAAAAG